MRNSLTPNGRIFIIMLLSAILLLGLIIFSGCRAATPDPFGGGIRIQAETAPRTNPSAKSALPGALASGRIIPGTIIPGGTGTTGGFLNTTNFAGVYDQTDAITNAQWQLDCNHQTVLPGSGCVFTDLVTVPIGGFIYITECRL
jgi:hypothetical protein